MNLQSTHRTRSFRILIYLPVFGLAATLLSTGCASRQPLARWQTALDKHVQENGGGDPNVLRDDALAYRSRSAVRPAQIRFSQVNLAQGVPLFSPIWDVHGVLVGVHSSAGNTWQVFVVGLVKRRPTGGVEDVRVVAYDAAASPPRWAVSSEDSKATSMYLSARDELDRPKNTTFPGADDAFELAVQGHQVRVRERQSGAVWTLKLPDGTAPAVSAPENFKT